jgi:TRAP-type uncharacterized transport system fused permease subunit
MKQHGHLFIPILLLIVMLLAGYSPIYSAWWSIVAVVFASYLRWDQRMRLSDILWALESGAKMVIPVAIACAIAGIVIASTTMTGIAQTITHNIVKLSEGILFYAELLWQGSVPFMIILRVILFVTGSCISLTGYAFAQLPWAARLVLLCGSGLLFIAKPYLPMIGVVLIVLTIVLNWLKARSIKGGENV